MSLLEVIERLCTVTRLQADIIQKQAEIIEQAKIAYSTDELETIGKEYN